MTAINSPYQNEQKPSRTPLLARKLRSNFQKSFTRLLAGKASILKDRQKKWAGNDLGSVNE